jgi:hypothetical protein
MRSLRSEQCSGITPHTIVPIASRSANTSIATWSARALSVGPWIFTCESISNCARVLSTQRSAALEASDQTSVRSLIWTSPRAQSSGSAHSQRKAMWRFSSWTRRRPSSTSIAASAERDHRCVQHCTVSSRNACLGDCGAWPGAIGSRIRNTGQALA